MIGGLMITGVGASYAAEQAADPAGMPHGFMHRHDGGECTGHGMLMGPMMHFPGLHLTDKQRDQLFQLMHDAEPGFYQKMKALRQSRENLRQAASMANYNPSQVRKLAEQEAQQQADIQVMHIELRHKMFALLTLEQQKQVLDQEKRHEPWGYGPNQGK
jgi:Spy/CpxP family protein refolding chaperone